MDEDEQFKRIQKICNPFEIKIEQLAQIKNQMLDEINSSSEIPTNLKKSLTFLQDLPTGCEHGRYLVIHLEDINFRIHLYHMRGGNDPIVNSEFYEILPDLLLGGGIELFANIANSLQLFLKKLQLEREPLTLVVELAAVVNEATSVFFAGSWKHSKCLMGICLGSEDTSVAYTEKTENIPPPNVLCPAKPFVISHLDWGVFGENGCLDHIRHELDIEVDKLSLHPRKRIYEKLICGHYMGELARQIFLLCTRENILFNGDIGKHLTVPFSFNLRHICEVLVESPDNFDNTRLMFDRLGIMKPTDNECLKVKYILECLVRRSATLLAVGCACLLERVEESHVLICIEGSFYENNLIYQQFLGDCLEKLLPEGKTFELKCVDQAIDIGAAVLAAVSQQQKFLYQAMEDNGAEVIQTSQQSTTDES
ncbi:hexokinase-like [Musca vetustissima]|uniref:hexokinase-like n=1 Tax=Musca vetustissima TaxID=27455 RepID=UPI002AB7CC89|nr:hexokinase-like [Musca vetustissima]